MWPDGERETLSGITGSHPHGPIVIVELESTRTDEKDPNCVCSGNLTFRKKNSSALAKVKIDRDDRGALMFGAKKKGKEKITPIRGTGMNVSPLAKYLTWLSEL